MITYSGVSLFPGERTYPTLLDIAVQTGRQPRFGGATNRWWPVLLHLLLCDEVMAVVMPTREMRLHILLHDAHEITGDIPSPWKNDQTRKDMNELDQRIYEGLGLILPTPEEKVIIHKVDIMALKAEAKIYGPPGCYEHPTVGGDASPDVIRSAITIGSIYPGPEFTNGPSAPAVTGFIRRVTTLINMPARQEIRWPI